MGFSTKTKWWDNLYQNYREKPSIQAHKWNLKVVYSAERESASKALMKVV